MKDLTFSMSANGRNVLIIPGLTTVPIESIRFSLPEVCCDGSEILCTAESLARVRQVVRNLDLARRIMVLPSPREMRGKTRVAETMIFALLAERTEGTTQGLAANWFVEDPRYKAQELPFSCGVTSRTLLLETIRYELSHFSCCLPVRYLLNHRHPVVTGKTA